MALIRGLQTELLHELRSDLSAGGIATQRQFPSNDAAWAEAFPAVTEPTAIWTFKETASPINDRVGTADLVQNQALLYAQAGDPEPTLAPQVGLEFDTTNTDEWTGPASTTFGNVDVGGSMSWYLRFRIPDVAAVSRSIFGKGDSGVARYLLRMLATTNVAQFVLSDGVNTTNISSVTTYDDGNYHDMLIVLDTAAGVLRMFIDGETVTAVALAAGLATTINTVGLVMALGLRFGSAVGAATLAGMRISYAAYWKNVALTAANFTTIKTPV